MSKFLGFGDCVFDDYFEQNTMYPGGNALNFCVYAKELGIESAFIGNLADDFGGEYLVRLMDEKGIDHSHCHVIEHTTTQCCRIKLEENDRVFYPDRESEHEVPLVRFEESMRAYMDQFDVVHLSCYCKAKDDVKNFKLNHAIVSYDLSNEKYTLDESYYKELCSCVDLLTFSSDMSLDDTKKLMMYMYELGCPNILATRGEYGQVFYNGMFYEGICTKVDAIDTCGAGDSFITAFLKSILDSGYKKGGKLSSDQVIKALHEGSVFSSEICMRRGAFGCEIITTSKTGGIN